MTDDGVRTLEELYGAVGRKLVRQKKQRLRNYVAKFFDMIGPCR